MIVARSGLSIQAIDSMLIDQLIKIEQSVKSYTEFQKELFCAQKRALLESSTTSVDYFFVLAWGFMERHFP